MLSWVKNKVSNYIRYNYTNNRISIEQKYYDFANFLILCKEKNIMPDICYTPIKERFVINVFIPSKDYDESIGDTFDEIKLNYKQFNFSYKQIVDVILFHSLTLEKFLGFLWIKSKFVPKLWEKTFISPNEMLYKFNEKEYIVPLKFTSKQQQNLIKNGIKKLLNLLKNKSDYCISIHDNNSTINIKLNEHDAYDENPIERFCLHFENTIDSTTFIKYYLDNDLESWYKLKFWL